MGLPAKLTEEEDALKKRYALLRKKREELRVKLAKAAANENQKVNNSSKKDVNLSQKAPIDAKELAKRKILSGEVKLSNDKSHHHFKRARSMSERKDRELLADDDRPLVQPPSRIMSNSLTSMDTSSDTDTSHCDSTFGRNRNFERRKGNTIFVAGYGLQESILENCFTKFGTLKNVHFEATKGHGFVTFSTHDAAEKAIAEMNGERAQGVILRVSMARKQPFDNRRRTFDHEERRGSFNQTYEVPLPQEGDRQKASEDQTKMNRALVVYDDDLSF